VSRKPRQRAKKGEIVIDARQEMLRIRFRFQGIRIERALGLPDTPGNRNRANKIAKLIDEAIADDKFTIKSLPSYLPNYTPPPPPPPAKGQLELFDDWCEWLGNRGTSPDTLAGRYATLRSYLAHWGEVTTADQAQSAINSLASADRPGRRNTPCSAATCRAYLSNFKGFGSWLVNRGHLEKNPWVEALPPKGGTDPTKRRAFSVAEVTQILGACQLPAYKHWYPYVALLLYTGLRPSEAIGLRWFDVDLVKGEMRILGALARSVTQNQRVRKTTKTGVSGNRTITIVPSLAAALETIPRGQPHDLLFSDPAGGPIDDNEFSQRDWRGILGAAGVAHRPPICVPTHLLVSPSQSWSVSAPSCGDRRAQGDRHTHEDLSPCC
jgi:integrase